ncbi:MAG: YabP/YqfC family sporulation protein [Lachnospiraceae bacterium]|nr:YabP/YqfC family sporulation protein [Lachnospiraceae bacterium]
METLQLPHDILYGEIRITITGNREIWIENYKGLLECNNNTILLQAKNHKLLLEGKALNIDYYTNEDMKISGRILSVKYL